MGAGSFGLAIGIGMQLLSLPLFLGYWDTSKYGAWLVLSALPSYLSMADAGMLTVAANQMAMAMGRGDAQEANRVFQSAQLFMLVVCGAIAVVTVPVALLIPLQGLDLVWDRVALLALALGVLLSLVGGLTEAAFRCTDRFATGTMFGSCIRLAEWVGQIAGLIWGGSFVAVALGGLLARLVGTLVAAYAAQSGQSALAWGVRHAQKSEMLSMAKPAMAFMAFPLSNALTFQGVTLLVGTLFGTTAVALFSTYRTIARLAVQLIGVFGNAVAPEFSRLFGMGDRASLKRLWRRSATSGLLMSCGISLLVYLATPTLLELWTHGNISFDPGLMALMLLYAAVGGAWHIPRALLSAVNRPKELAHWSILASLLVLGLAWQMGNVWQLYGVTLAMLLTETALALMCTYLVYKAVFHTPHAAVPATTVKGAL